MLKSDHGHDARYYPTNANDELPPPEKKLRNTRSANTAVKAKAIAPTSNNDDD